jgi:hypothetical protein
MSEADPGPHLQEGKQVSALPARAGSPYHSDATPQLDTLQLWDLARAGLPENA